MGWIAEKIASLFFSVGLGTIGDKFLKPYLEHLNTTAKIDGEKFKAATGAERDVIIAQAQANAGAWKDRVDLLKGLGITQWLIAAALIPPLMHQGAIYFDSTPFPVLLFHGWWPSIGIHEMGSWAVVKAPAPYDTREAELIGSLLGIQGVVTGGSVFMRFLTSKK